MITLAPTIPPINYYKSTINCWRIVKTKPQIIYGVNNKTISLNPILEIPLEMLTAQTTYDEAVAMLYAMIANGELEQSEIDAVYLVLPPQ